MEDRRLRNGLRWVHGVMRRLAVSLLLVLLMAGSVAADDANMVVITAKGKKYHRPDCRTVKQALRTLTAEEARNLGYTPCKVCKP